MISEDSPLRHPPANLSRRQVLILDGIRFAADMADIAYGRLADHLQRVAEMEADPTVVDIATGMLDAWSIVDSAHRMRDLVENLPGLPNSPWTRLLREHTQGVAELRDCVQHQLGEIDGLLGGGQLWGYLSWAELRNGLPTGVWHMMAAGSEYVGDTWFYAGPAQLPFTVPRDRIRLNAFGGQIYLARIVEALTTAIDSLERDLSSGRIRPIGPPAVDWRGADAVRAQSIDVLVVDASGTPRVVPLRPEP